MAKLDWTKQGYKIINNFFTKKELEILQEYCFKQLESGAGAQYDEQSGTGAAAWYKDTMATTFLSLKRPLVEKASGYALLETYTYWRYYCFGSKLTKHTDRPACQISVTANIKSYDESPIVVEGDSINLKEGQAILYYGCLAKHWRPGIYKGDGMAQVFFHYVDANGPFYHHEQDKYLLATGNTASENDEKIVEEMTKKFYEGRK